MAIVLEKHILSAWAVRLSVWRKYWDTGKRITF
jgi:hypothetical protein